MSGRRAFGSLGDALLVAVLFAACRSASNGNEDGASDTNDGGASDRGGEAGSAGRGSEAGDSAGGVSGSGNATSGGEAGDGSSGNSAGDGATGGDPSGGGSGGMANGGTESGGAGAQAGAATGGSGAGGSGGGSGGAGSGGAGSGGAGSGGAGSGGSAGAAGGGFTGLGEPGTCPLRRTGATGSEPNRAIPMCCVPTLAEQAIVEELVSLINAWRLENDQPVLRFDAVLSTVAQAHSLHMGTHRFFAVEAPEVTYRLTSVRARECSTVASDESNWIVSGAATPAAVIELAEGSQFGRMQLLTRANTVIGVGYTVTDQTYWTLLLR